MLHALVKLLLQQSTTMMSCFYMAMLHIEKNSRAKCFDVQCFNKSDLTNVVVDCLWCVFVCICVSVCVILYQPKFAFTKLSEDILPHAAQLQYTLFRRQKQDAEAEKDRGQSRQTYLFRSMKTDVKRVQKNVVWRKMTAAGAASPWMSRLAAANTLPFTVTRVWALFK